MPEEEFRTNWINDDGIEVEDSVERHVWTFQFGKNAAGERVIADRHFRSGDTARATELSGQAERFAERLALHTGRIDRTSSS